MRTCLLCEQEFTAPVYFARIFSMQKFNPVKLCPFCSKQFEKITGNQCSYCSKPLKQGAICQDCQRWQKEYDGQVLRNYSLYRYNSAFHDLMVAYKRRGDYVLREVLQQLCREYLSKTEYDLYVPVPTSPEHQKRRQFDTIAAIYGDLLPLTPLLQKKAGTHAQGEKSRSERLKAFQSFFIDNSIKIRDNIETGKILILDDIYTTGRTLYHARDCLRAAFPGMQIESFSICR